MGPPWVGYKIRFHDRTARSTRIKFMTDGILLAEAQKDRLFRAYDTLIIDEAHHLEAAATDSLTYAIDRDEVGRMLGELGRTTGRTQTIANDRTTGS